MSKNPSPRLDHLRAMREAQFARSVVRQKDADKPAVTEKPAKADKAAKAEQPAKPDKPAKAAKSAPKKQKSKKAGP